MIQNVNTAVAMRFGVTAALVADFLWDQTGNPFSIEHSWFRYSHKMFTLNFPYLSERTIRRTLKKLTEKGVLKKSELNTSCFDRTLSYKFTDFGEEIMYSAASESGVKEYDI